MGGGPMGESPMQFYDPEAELAARCVDPTIKADPVWEEFAKAFNEEFKSILHVFAQDAMGCEDPAQNEDGSPKIKYSAKGKQSGDNVTGSTLEGLFTSTQRVKLTNFMNDHKIPERLFDGDDVGYATTSQRLLMAAHILMVGTYSPASFEQRLHANNCGHWIDLTFDYAGAAVGTIGKGMMGTTDHNGDVIMGKGGLNEVFRKDKVKAAELPKEEGENQLGPIGKTTKHYEAIKRDEVKLAKDPEAKPTAVRRPYADFAMFGTIQPGDWIWVYNANSSDDGGHSFIFSHWSSDEGLSNGIRFRKAIGFNQGHVEQGGQEFEITLGEKFFSGEDDRLGFEGKHIGICPVTMILQVSKDTQPITEVDELLPKVAANEGTGKDDNEIYIAKFEATYNRKIDRKALRGILTAECEATVGKLGDHLSVGQQSVIAEAQETASLSQLVWLTLRLREILYHVSMLNDLSTVAYNNADDAHIKWEKDIADKEADLASLDEEIQTLKDAMGKLAAERDILDLEPEIKKLKKGLRGAQAKLWALNKKDPDYASNAKIAQLKIDSYEALIAAGTKSGTIHKADIVALNAKIAKLQNSIYTLENGVKNKDPKKSKMGQKAKKAALAKAIANEPFARPHPNDGFWNNHRYPAPVTSLLKDALSYDDMMPAKGTVPIKPEKEEKPKEKPQKEKGVPKPKAATPQK